MATYNWDIGAIERPTAEPRKFEVPSHQWIDLTDMSGEFGATILTDCKNGSDKPTDNTIRLHPPSYPRHRRRLRRPGDAEILGITNSYTRIAGHAMGWRDAETDWQVAQRLNAPLIALANLKTPGRGRQEDVAPDRQQLTHTAGPGSKESRTKRREVVVRFVELEGKLQSNV